DERKANTVGGRHCFVEVLDDGAFGDLDVDRPHRVLELETILSQLDGFDGRPNQRHAVLLEYAGLSQIDGQVQRRLAADGRQDRVRLFARDDLLNGRDGERLDVRPVGRLRVRHDRRRIAV